MELPIISIQINRLQRVICLIYKMQSTCCIIDRNFGTYQSNMEKRSAVFSRQIWSFYSAVISPIDPEQIPEGMEIVKKRKKNVENLILLTTFKLYSMIFDRFFWFVAAQILYNSLEKTKNTFWATRFNHTVYISSQLSSPKLIVFI